MSLDRSGPYEIFLAHLESISAGGADSAAAGGAAGAAGSGLVFEAASAAVHGSHAWLVRRKLVNWVGEQRAWPAGEQPSSVLFDLAGISLVNALSLAHGALTSAVPPGRFLKQVASGIAGAVAGSNGKRGFAGFADKLRIVEATWMAQHTPPRYRTFVLAAYAQALATRRASEEVVETAVRSYVREVLADAGRAQGPRGHRFAGGSPER